MRHVTRATYTAPFVLVALFLSSFIAASAHAQWTNTANPTLSGKAGIGVAHHSTVRLRLAETVPGTLTIGPFHLAFGSDTAMWWAYRLDGTNNLHLDRQGNSGWAEGFVFDRDGDFGIGTPSPTQLLHATRDHNAGTLIQVSNASTGASAYTGLLLTEGAFLKGELSSTNSGSTHADGPNALRLTNHGNGPLIFRSNGGERMRIWGNGNISIGAPNDLGRLSVVDYADGSVTARIHHDVVIETDISQNDYGTMSTTVEHIPTGVTNSGTFAGAQFEAWADKAANGTSGTLAAAVAGRFLAGNLSTAATTINKASGMWTQVQAGGGTIVEGRAVEIADTIATNDYAIYQMAASDTNYFAGNVMIGGTASAATSSYALEVTGHANFNGTVTGTNIKAHYQDLAEWVPATTDLAPGTVVILNRGRHNEVMASTTSYDTTVAGVVSAQPGISLGVEGSGKEQIATTGRVRVRVDARVHAIRVGDLLVTSDLPGTAMRSEPMDINGRAFHQPGTIIGKALEPLEGAIGEILVLLSMQ
ncbi:MAG TPA: hypothetical protein VEK11_14265 [Thermoanaerobaculia bacterium]|nr:hypothetical protein [Thermoanaerobaculia bacterium]